MKFTIKRLDRSEINTKYGRKWKVTATTETDQRVSSFANKYTAAWKEGMVVDVETKQNGEYINCVWPKEDYRPQAPVSHPRNDEMMEMLKQILKLVSDIHVEIWEGKPKKEMSHAAEDVPFDPEERQPEEF